MLVHPQLVRQEKEGFSIIAWAGFPGYPQI
jgi:hypothetical protein